MPAGIGPHPYFPKAPDTALTFDCTGVWPPDAPEAVALGAGPLEPGLDFRHGQNVGPIVFDRCFEGWSGLALSRPRQPDSDGSRPTVPSAVADLRCLGLPYICIEPVTNANDGSTGWRRECRATKVVCFEPGRFLAGRIIIAAR